MEPLVAGFWGAFFGTAALMLAGAVAAFLGSLRRVAVMAAISSALYIVFAASYLDLVQLAADPALRLRINGSVFMLAAVLLGHLVIAMLGHLREPQAARRRRAALYGLGIVFAGTSWLLPAQAAFALCTAGGICIGVVALSLCIRRAQRGDRLAIAAIVGVLAISVSVLSLTWIAVAGPLPWPVHALAATTGMVYLVVVALVLWLRFSYLIELRQVISHGPAYDPITRMRTHSETGQMVGLAFFNQAQQGALVGVIAVSIGNLLTLEKLHGRAAVNHGLFVSAGRLRRALPGVADAGRLGEDGFLVLVRDVDDVDRLVAAGHLIAERLTRPVALSTSAEMGQLESGKAQWVAQVGVGIVVAAVSERPSAAVARARALSRAAWGFPSRVAWEDDSGHVAEAPQYASA